MDNVRVRVRVHYVRARGFVHPIIGVVKMSNGKEKSGNQMEVPGTPADDLTFYDRKVSEAVDLVESAKANLRRAQASEKTARLAHADALKRLA